MLLLSFYFPSTFLLLFFYFASINHLHKHIVRGKIEAEIEAVQTTPTPPRSALPLGSAKNLGGGIITLSPVFDEMVIKVIRNAH